MKNAPAAKSNESASNQGQYIPLTKRQQRVLQALLQGPVTRKEVDAIAHASNGPGVIFQLRRKDIEIDTARVPCRDYDGKASWFGRYHLVTPRHEVRAMLEVAK